MLDNVTRAIKQLTMQPPNRHRRFVCGQI